MSQQEASGQYKPGAVGGTSPLLRLVDVQEQYGRHVIEDMLARVPHADLACDLGVGGGDDLGIVAKRFPGARLIGIDCSDTRLAQLQQRGIELRICNLEHDDFPCADGSVDLLIANQVLEHVKELFWIWHQIALKLRVGGHAVIGVPNIAALHNRLAMLLFGAQPSQMKSYSAHVRGFTASEVPRFLSVCFPGGFECVLLRGAQFYPFPRSIARVLARVFPSLAHSSFYLFRKTAAYRGEFISHPVEAGLETPFFVGPGASPIGRAP